MTEDQLVLLTESLRASSLEYRCYLNSEGDWRVQALTSGNSDINDVIDLTAKFGIQAVTDRTEFR